ncbi:hypothetical protein BY996DRAFT_6622421 [Phakopsora pachyrhizi]|nr:hypothetical protein BY996DRAFT_6622421 [Phakopsora pachyrhizi]
MSMQSGLGDGGAEKEKELDIADPTNAPLADEAPLKAERVQAFDRALISAPLGGITDKSLASDGKRARVSLQSCKIVMSRRSEEPQPSNQTIDPESINHQSESTTVSILSSQQMTVVKLQHSSSSSLPVSLRHPLSPTTSPRPTPKPKSTNNTKPTAIRPHTPDLTYSMPESPSQINFANLMEKWGGGGSSELSYRLPDPPSPISALEINLSTQSNKSQSSLNCSLKQHPGFLGQNVDPMPLPNQNLPQCTVIIQALPPSEHPKSNRSNTPGEEEDDDDFLGNEELYSTQTHLSPKDEILPISGPLREMVRIIKEQALKIEEERHWLTSKLVKLTSSNQVLERGKM